ncbi:hypothetical protein os1_01190 [Comamonadaceae bacterium OS-1]|nr:hypothetical protein os1_01190 [Comamonadaceae bacterium OS-1]
MEPILQEWQDFAATLVPPGQTMNKVALRDHIKLVLETVAADLDQPQTERDATDKSKGLNETEQEDTAANEHGKERLAFGFGLDAAVAEYRALRASVTRLWQKSLKDETIPATAVRDLIRFNEAIDQAITESVTSYAYEKEQLTRMFDTILSSSPDLSFTFDLDGHFAYANQAMTALLGCKMDDITGKLCAEVGLPGADALQQSIAAVIHSKKPVRGEMRYAADGVVTDVYDYIFAPVVDVAGNVEAVVGTARNVTDRKATEEHNWRSANYDSLTGLPNRRLFLDRLDLQLRHAARSQCLLALLFIDLDHFKEINDTLGHEAGDALLRQAALRIQSCLRKEDTVARLGGDEFTVILPDLGSPEHAKAVATVIQRELARPFDIAHPAPQVSGSIGVAFYPQDGLTVGELVKSADSAMYLAKRAGRDQFSFCAAREG